MASRSENKARYKAKKKHRFYTKLRKYAHNIFTIGMYLSLVVFAYVLFYSLLFEPLILSKSYGRSDTVEFIYLAVTGFIIGLSYLIRHLVNYNEEQQWQRNWRLLRDVKFYLDRYASLKRMGIDHLNKRKKKRRHSAPESKEKSN